jgi:hypothetical protein
LLFLGLHCFLRNSVTFVWYYSEKFSKLIDEKFSETFRYFLMNNSVRYFYADRNGKYLWFVVCGPERFSANWLKCIVKLCNSCHMFKPSICILDFSHALCQLRPDSRLPSATHPYSGAWRLRACRIRPPAESHRWRRIRCQCVCWCIQSLCIQNKICEACIILVGNSFTVLWIAGLPTDCLTKIPRVENLVTLSL